MLYPKINLIKQKNKKIFHNIIMRIKEVIYKNLKSLQNKDYFILFLKKNFHI